MPSSERKVHRNPFPTKVYVNLFVNPNSENLGGALYLSVSKKTGFSIQKCGEHYTWVITVIVSYFHFVLKRYAQKSEPIWLISI